MKFTLLYYPELAGALRKLGIPHPGEAAIFLSQLSYWLKKEGCGRMTRDGKHWIYNTYQKWVSQIKSLTVSQFGKMIRALASFGLIEKTTFGEQRHSLKKEKPVGFSSWNNTTWVTLCIEKIIELTGSNPFEDETEDEIQEEKSEAKNSEALEPAPRTNLLNRTSDDSESNDGCFQMESSSIYKENLSFTKDGANSSEKEKKAGFSNTSSGSNPVSPTDKEQLSEKPKISEEDNCRENSEVRDNRNNEVSGNLPSPPIRVKRTVSQDAVQEVWEIASGRPFPAFLNWRANCHYKPQGGKWETDAYGNAYSEFYRNREKTTAVLFPQFMNEVRGIVEKVHNAQSCDAIAANVLPSWFIEIFPDATPENVKQLMENLDAVIERGTRISLPSKANTPSDITASYHEAHSQVAIKPLPSLSAPVLKGVEVPALNGVEEPILEKQRTLARKQAQWNAPLLRDRVRRWAEQTPGVVLTENGPQLETAEIEAASDNVETIINEVETDKVETTLNNTAPKKVETILNNKALEKVETILNNKALEKVETILNNKALEKVETILNKVVPKDVETFRDDTAPGEVETSNPLVSKQVDKVSSNNHGVDEKADVEVNNPSTEVGADVSSNNSPSSNSERSPIANNRGFEEKAGVKTNNPSNLNSKFVIDDPWEYDETPFCNLEEGKEVHSFGTEAKPSLMKLMLAVWDNIYELGKIVLNARSEDLIKAVSSLSSHQIAHIKQAATRAWYPGLNRDGDYKGERVEIWEVGQSPTVKVRTKRGAFLKVKRNDLKPWLCI